MIRKLINLFLFRYIYPSWNVGVGVLCDGFVPESIRWVNNPFKDRWFADPFLYEEDSDYFHILVEEFLRDEKKGRISALSIRKSDMFLTSIDTLLDLESHLSFPIQIIVDGKTFIYPESSASGVTSSYLFDGNSVVFNDIILPKPVADPVIVEIEGEYYLFCTDSTDCNGKRLEIYHSKNALGGYSFFQSVVFPENIARRAGRFFRKNSALYSPAQVCNNDYGEGISLQEVKMENGMFIIKEVCRMYPSSKSYPDGFHTYNLYNDLVVIDGYRYRCPKLRKLFYAVRDIVTK